MVPNARGQTRVSGTPTGVGTLAGQLLARPTYQRYRIIVVVERAPGIDRHTGDIHGFEHGWATPVVAPIVAARVDINVASGRCG